MFRSLRARLGLSYAAVIASIFCVVGAALIIYLSRNPLLYRQAVLRLQVAETSILRRSPAPTLVNKARLQSLVEREDEIFDVRVIILQDPGLVLADSRPDPSNAIRSLPSPLQRGGNLTATLRDASGSAWLYTQAPLTSQYSLILAVPRPRLQLRAIFGDDMVVVLVRASLMALALAMLLAWAMGRWISAPLQRLAGGLKAAEGGDYRPVHPEGPEEVQALGVAFNSMAHAVQRSRQSQQDFVANVSHELKTPLTSIQGFAQAILDGMVTSPEAVRQAAGVIHEESSRMYRLVFDLLSLARIETGKRLDTVPVDLISLLTEVKDTFTPPAEKNGIRIHLSQAELPAVSASRDRLEQVFTNLVENAVKFSPPGGTVWLSARQNGRYVEVCVKDEGPGIPESQQERIFERFYQLDPARSGGSGRGAGLGLAIAREIIHAHGGSIRVESNPGQGSEFIVSLPAS